MTLAGHAGSGKTSLVEALAYRTGASDRLGKIAEGNTISDYDPEEVKRKASLGTTLVSLDWLDTKLNLLDTPGLFDFAGSVAESLRACDGAVITVSGKSGVTGGTVKAYEAAVENRKARLFVVTKLDAEHADFYKVLEDLKAQFGPSICPLVVPVGEGGQIESYINLFRGKAFTYDSKGVASEIEIPDIKHRFEGLMTAISEAVAETDEALFEKYFSGESFTDEELIGGIRKGVASGELTPVYCVSSANLGGVDMVLDAIVNLLPAPDASQELAEDETGDPVEVACDEAAPASCYVFKTIADPFVGKMSYIKVVSGRLASDTTLVNRTTGVPQRMGKLFTLRGKKQIEMEAAQAGDIVVASKLAANTFDTLSAAEFPVVYARPKLPKPCYFMAVTTDGKADDSKVSGALARLLEEDLTLSFQQDPDTHEQVLGGLGEQHLDVAVSKLKDKFGVSVTLEVPKVAYRETIRKKVKVEGKHKKQTGGHGQYGHVWIEFEPCDSDTLVFEENVFGGSVPRNYFPAVEKGLQECVHKGVLEGYPVVGLKATLVDGSYHPVDSSEMAFKMAASIAYKAGMEQASPVILEPIGMLKAVVPDKNTGDLIGDMNKRRGRVLGMNPAKAGYTEVEAEVPMAEMHDFTTVLRQMTQGMGEFELEVCRYAVKG